MNTQIQLGVLAIRLVALGVFIYLLRAEVWAIAIGLVFVVLTLLQMYRAIRHAELMRDSDPVHRRERNT
ncbi:hypothetical protein [Corynebacterium aquilae]|uniref:Uncharacterized protein n=1 Tax=Corynebacterium aquilae DSM 44791 TaxID=1431546 RepID=A0A1L7CFT2_9CORY|nr:hypothetical protein [Corynebacterium aquilae]APT84730.1 hypothetical protein CAQU_06220 [Corynebacterium aquilae DSM 44791]